MTVREVAIHCITISKYVTFNLLNELKNLEWDVNNIQTIIIISQYANLRNRFSSLQNCKHHANLKQVRKRFRNFKLEHGY